MTTRNGILGYGGRFFVQKNPQSRQIKKKPWFQGLGSYFAKKFVIKIKRGVIFKKKSDNSDKCGFWDSFLFGLLGFNIIKKAWFWKKNVWAFGSFYKRVYLEMLIYFRGPTNGKKKTRYLFLGGFFQPKGGYMGTLFFGEFEVGDFVADFFFAPTSAYVYPQASCAICFLSSWTYQLIFSSFFGVETYTLQVGSSVKAILSPCVKKLKLKSSKDSGF